MAPFTQQDPLPAASAAPRAAAPALTAPAAARAAWLSTGAATAAATAGLSTSRKKRGRLDSTVGFVVIFLPIINSPGV